ncbi:MULTISPECIES: SH3 domain-containing protein [unclassified Corallococcus]|uniref:SH3 domain-containing protein n=1 Tax=unclassified Corallococcus TaxID=2685029 RepID=UPI001A8FF27A|nr:MULTISPECIES: SH3 domain-containing protein [unclassified Corallococcus]MBN9682279.1 SH3 domain-containing protein [Corallococcus sp. NCSPR001]WAS86165.1 SH3 domain-containing protein [Corallococcus sp. NCRR]
MIQFPRFMPLAVPPRPQPLPAPAGRGQPAPQPQPFGSTSSFDATPAPASNLHTERLGDGSANCLEKAVGLARPGDSIVLMRDASDGVGHALVRRPDGSVVDPNHPTVRYETLGQWQATHPRYSQPVPVPASRMQQVLSTPPGPQREALIQKLGLSGVADRRVADGERWVTPTGNMNIRSGPGTNFADVGDLKAGDKLKVLDQTEDGSWLNVELMDGTQAWVSESLTGPTAAPPPPPPPYESPVPKWMADGTCPPDIEMHVWTQLPKESRAEILQTAREKVVAEHWPMPEFDVNGPPPASVDSLVWDHLPPEGKESLFRQEWQAAVREQTALIFNGVPEGGAVAEHPFLGVDSSLGNGQVGEWLDNALQVGSAAQYINLEKALGQGWRQVHYNLCGPLAVGASLGMSPKEALTAFAATSAGILNSGTTTTATPLETVYEARGWTTGYTSGTASMPAPEDMARMLDDGKALIALVNIDTKGADGMLTFFEDSTQAVAHWVSVSAVEENGKGDWTVRVYNPFENREELYAWDDFEASWGKNGGLVPSTEAEGEFVFKFNAGHGLLVATPPPPDAATSP